jgi:hypothetical protein
MVKQQRDLSKNDVGNSSSDDALHCLLEWGLLCGEEEASVTKKLMGQ